MSIQNRFLTEGKHKILKEHQYQTFIAKLYCLVKGHVPVRFDVDGDIKNKQFCLCCWREL